MRKPIIAITPKTGNGGDEDSKFCYVFPNFINCVSACGGIPIQLSSLEGSFQVADLDELLERVDGVLFSGGPDIHPGLYGEELLDCCGALAPERDALEIPLMQKAIAMDKPVFGICRGFQVLNVVTGGTMYQDINTQNKSSVHIEHQRTKPEEKDKVMHKVNVIRDTPLHTFSEGLLQIGVNTLHHQGVKSWASRCCSMAIADDGIVEAAYYPGKKFVMGVQWHPGDSGPWRQGGEQPVHRLCGGLRAEYEVGLIAPCFFGTGQFFMCKRRLNDKVFRPLPFEKEAEP